jgi:hypothetical protein
VQYIDVEASTATNIVAFFTYETLADATQAGEVHASFR